MVDSGAAHRNPLRPASASTAESRVPRSGVEQPQQRAPLEHAVRAARARLVGVAVRSSTGCGGSGRAH
jgi:hypothetical protein